MSQSNHLNLVEQLSREVVERHAAKVDEEGRFPEESIAEFQMSGLAGLLSAKEVGGMGQGPRAGVEVIERLARACGSTAMVATMHYSGAMVIEKYGDESTRRAIAEGKHLSTLAFSETGSRSAFWVPIGTATKAGDKVKLNAKKSFVTSASRATAYVWASKPLAAEGLSTLWLVPRDTAGLKVQGTFDGLGLRGNDSAPVTGADVTIPAASMLGPDGGGFDIMLNVVLPFFNIFTGATAVGIMEAGTTATAGHAAATKFEYDGSRICDLPTVRNYIARMRCKTDSARTLLFDTVAAMETQRPDTVLRVLQSKANAGESATEVLDLGMRVCGGAAYRGDVGVERMFRDARAGTVMAPTTDQLYDFIGKAVCGMDVF
jgi:alkylation response protein AidB-like acyl-CoA dehydrogenase